MFFKSLWQPFLSLFRFAHRFSLHFSFGFRFVLFRFLVVRFLFQSSWYFRFCFVLACAVLPVTHLLRDLVRPSLLMELKWQWWPITELNLCDFFQRDRWRRFMKLTGIEDKGLCFGIGKRMKTTCRCCGGGSDSAYSLQRPIGTAGAKTDAFVRISVQEEA